MGLHHQAVVGDGVDRRQHLQRRHGDALAEAVGADLALLPGGIARHGHRPGGLPLQVDARWLPEAKRLDHAVEAGWPHLPRHGRSANVQGLNHHLSHVDQAVRGAIPVPDRDPAALQAGLVVVCAARQDHAFLDPGRQRHDLEDRSRLVLLADGRVAEQARVVHLVIDVGVV